MVHCVAKPLAEELIVAPSPSRTRKDFMCGKVGPLLKLNLARPIDPWYGAGASKVAGVNPALTIRVIRYTPGGM